MAEHDNSKLALSTLNVVSAASKIGGDITILIAGHGSEAVAKAASAIPGIKSVLHADNAAYKNGVAENITNAVSKVAGGIFIFFQFMKVQYITCVLIFFLYI